MFGKMLRKLQISILLWLTFSVILGLFYPLVVTMIARVMCPWKSNGSFVMIHNQKVGSLLIGQSFEESKYFWGRISATPNYPYNATYSGGSNLGPTNNVLIDRVKNRIAALHKADPNNKNPIPIELVTASGSGLDPEISMDAAFYQVPRIARFRKIPDKDLIMLIQHLAKLKKWGLLGEPRVNVLELNLALDVLEKRDAT